MDLDSKSPSVCSLDRIDPSRAERVLAAMGAALAARAGALARLTLIVAVAEETWVRERGEERFRIGRRAHG